jgi:hypothetical protein
MPSMFILLFCFLFKFLFVHAVPSVNVCHHCRTSADTSCWLGGNSNLLYHRFILMLSKTVADFCGLLQIHICCKADHIQISYCAESDCFSPSFIEYSPCQEMVQMKVVDLNEVHILCQVPVFCTVSCCWENHYFAFIVILPCLRPSGLLLSHSIIWRVFPKIFVMFFDNRIWNGILEQDIQRTLIFHSDL